MSENHSDNRKIMHNCIYGPGVKNEIPIYLLKPAITAIRVWYVPVGADETRGGAAQCTHAHLYFDVDDLKQRKCLRLLKGVMGKARGKESSFSPPLFAVLAVGGLVRVTFRSLCPNSAPRR